MVACARAVTYGIKCSDRDLEVQKHRWCWCTLWERNMPRVCLEDTAHSKASRDTSTHFRGSLDMDLSAVLNVLLVLHVEMKTD